MKQYKIYLCILLLFISFSELKSNPDIPQDSLGNHLWYIEIWGSAISVSFNYEYIFSKNTLLFDYISLRTGIGASIIFFYRYGSPLMINFIVGKKHCLDIGIGALFDYYIQNQPEYDYPHQAIKFTGNIGYRFIGDGGFIFRIGLTPTYYSDRGFLPLIGISFGHYF